MGHVALLPSHVLLALLQPDVDTTDALSSMSSGLYHSASRCMCLTSAGLPTGETYQSSMRCASAKAGAYSSASERGPCGQQPVAAKGGDAPSIPTETAKSWRITAGDSEWGIPQRVSKASFTRHKTPSAYRNAEGHGYAVQSVFIFSDTAITDSTGHGGTSSC